MIDWSLIIATILGGFVAGVVGLYSAFVSRYLDRRERHLNEHKDNFKVIDKAITELRNEIWPFHYGAEMLKLGNPQYEVIPESIKYGILGISLFYPPEGNEPAEIIKVEKDLYKDMGKHFRNLANLIADFEESVKTDGIQISKLLHEISEKIYSDLYESDILLLKGPFARTGNASLKDLIGGIEEQDYAGVIFLFVIDEDENSWPNRKRAFTMYNLLNRLREIADKVKSQLRDKVREMTQLLEKIDDLADESRDLLEKEKHNFKLKGRCEFVRF